MEVKWVKPLVEKQKAPTFSRLLLLMLKEKKDMPVLDKRLNLSVCVL